MENKAPHTKNFYLQYIPGKEDVGFGFGETSRSYEERQHDNEYIKADSSNLLFSDGVWTAYEWWKNRTVINRENGQDKEVHAFLNSIPGVEQIINPKTKRKLEVFKFTRKGFGKGLTLEIIKDMLDKKFFTSGDKKKLNLERKRHQEEFIVKSAWQEWKEFLLFAKCRAGKTVMSLGLICEKGYKVTLIVSRVTSVKKGWIEDANKFYEFSNLAFISIHGNKSWHEEFDYWMKTDKQIVLFDTVQGAHKKDISSLNVDFVVYDEAHIGAGEGTHQWKNLRSMFDCPVLYVTGTAYKMVDDFTDTNTYVYSYFEEQLDKKKGLNDRPSMELVLANYDTQYKECFGGDADSLNNLFRVGDDGEFIDPSAVKEFVSGRFDEDRRVRPHNRLLNDSTHIYITLPSVAACYAFAEYLKGTRFAPLVVTGDSKNDPSDINKHLKENPTGAAVLTRTANVLGVTAKTVDTVINLSQGESIEFWTQFAFRGGSSDHDWRVIDFVPDRCLSSLREMFILATENEPQLTEYEFTDFIRILEWDNGFTTLSQSEVSELMAKDPRDTQRFISSLANGMNLDILKDLGFNPELKSSDGGKATSRNLNEQGTDKTSNKKRITKLEKGETSDESKLISHVKAILERLPIFIINLIQNGDIVDSLTSLTSHPEYSAASGDNDNVLIRYCGLDREFSKKLNSRINQLSVDLISAYTEDPIGTLEDLSVSDSDSRQIPSALFTEMCPSPSNDEETLAIVYDPVGLHSTVAMSLGWKPEQITVIDENPRHLFSIKAVDAKINMLPESILNLDTMNFDVTIGNPPYLKNLHLIFLKTGLEQGKVVNLVHPSGWLFRTSNKLEKEVKSLADGRVKKLIIFNGNTTFPGAQFACPLVRTFAVESHSGPIEVQSQITGNTYYINDLSEFPTGYWEPTPEHLELVKKFKELSVVNLNSLVTKNVDHFLGCPRVVGHGHIMKSDKYAHDDFNVFFYRNSDIYNAKPEEKVFGVSSRAERDSLESYLRTKFARFGLSINKVSQDLYVSRYLSNVPVPPLDRSWDDESLAEYYGLTPEQAELIDRHIPTYY